MKAEEFVKILNSVKKIVFSINDVTKILYKDSNYCKVFLNRLEKRKLIVKLERNKYVLPSQDPLLVASSIIFPCYISFISAYYFYNITTQIPKTIFVFSKKQRKDLLYEGVRIKFVKFSPQRFFGYKRENLNGKTIFIAEIEKAILDSIFLPQYTSIHETWLALKEGEIKEERIIEYTKRMNSNALAKRLGYLLELNGIDIYSKIKDMIDKNYVKLNQFKARKGEKNKKWKILINEVLE